MSEESFRIKDWEVFQHFKDRRPPWIKLYRDLLDDPEWHFLDAESAKVLVMLWLIASEDKTGCGILPKLSVLCFRLRTDEKTLKNTLNKLSHWLVQDDIAMISEGYHDGPPEKRREEEETEKEKRKNPSKNKNKIVEIYNSFAAKRQGWAKCSRIPSGEAGKLLDARVADTEWVAAFPEQMRLAIAIDWMDKGTFTTMIRPDAQRKILDAEWSSGKFKNKQEPTIKDVDTSKHWNNPDYVPEQPKRVS